MAFAAVVDAATNGVIMRLVAAVVGTPDSDEVVPLREIRDALNASR